MKSYDELKAEMESIQRQMVEVKNLRIGKLICEIKRNF